MRKAFAPRLLPSTLLAAILALIASRPAFAADVLTFRNGNARLGVNREEALLTRANVTSAEFGKLFSQDVDGAIYAQPLVMSNVPIPGRGTHNVVFVATEHDSVYAFDADNARGSNAEPLWHVSFLSQTPQSSVTPVSFQDVSCDNIAPEIGITGTPVIDPSNGTLYVVAKTREIMGTTVNYVQRLHALDVATGSEKFGGPRLLLASVQGTGIGSVGGIVSFDPLRANNRPALLLLGGVVYLGFSSHCDVGVYHGWVLGYDARTLQRVAVFCTTPNGGLGGVWMSGDGLAADDSGNIFFATGNGTFDGDTGGPDVGDSILKFSTSAGLALEDSFTPHNQAALNAEDGDVGSGGVILLPDSPEGNPPRLLVAEGKEGVLYLMDRDHMGGYDPNADHCIQSVPISYLPAFHTPSFFNGALYTGSSFDRVRAFPLVNGLLSGTPSSSTGTSFVFPGPSPAISSNGDDQGIVWVLGFGDAAVLHAYDASDLSAELYNSAQAAGGRDQPGAAVKFAVPTVVNGKVYVGTQTNVTAFGLLPPAGREGAQPLPLPLPAELPGR